MIEPIQVDDGVRMLRDGRSDEDIERTTGLSLLRIIELRASAATAPSRTPSLSATGRARAKETA